jgi:hypothetical protein
MFALGDLKKREETIATDPVVKLQRLLDSHGPEGMECVALAAFAAGNHLHRLDVSGLLLCQHTQVGKPFVLYFTKRNRSTSGPSRFLQEIYLINIDCMIINPVYTSVLDSTFKLEFFADQPIIHTELPKVLIFKVDKLVDYTGCDTQYDSETHPELLEGFVPDPQVLIDSIFKLNCRTLTASIGTNLEDVLARFRQFSHTGVFNSHSHVKNARS